MKANVGWSDAHHDQALGSGATGIERILHAQDVEEELLSGFGSIESDNAGRVITRKTLDLLPNVKDEGVIRHVDKQVDVAKHGNALTALIKRLQGESATR